MTVPLHTRVAAGFVLSAMVMLAACSSIEEPEQPRLPDGASFGLVVSDPVLVPSSAAARADGRRTAAETGQEVAYVSSPPGMFPDGATATIANLITGASRSETILNGGFDPVSIPAAVGDTLEIAILDGAAAVIVRMASEVPARVPPVVVRTEPEKGKVDVLLNVKPTVVFSEPVDPQTVTPETVKLLLDGEPVQGGLTLSTDGLRAEFTPAETLARQRTYTLMITAGVADLAGDSLQQQVEVTFAIELGGVIAFMRFDGDAGLVSSAIYRMNLDGSGLVELADGQSPAWSPGGSKIAFWRCCGDGIYVMNADGTGIRQLTNHGVSKPAWSPDGSKIAFTSNRDGNGEVYVMNADGSAQTNLTNNPAVDGPPTWSPDGSKIAFASDRDGGGIYVMDADGSNVARLNDDGYAPAWSPDGSKIAFGTARDGNQEVYVMNADGTGEVNLTQDPAARDRWPTWSPDGTRIVFSSWRGRPFQASPPLDIYVMNADGSGVLRITASDEWWDFVPHWRP